jgi:hypothetical protein
VKCAFVTPGWAENTGFAHHFTVIIAHTVHNAVSCITNGPTVC